MIIQFILPFVKKTVFFAFFLLSFGVFVFSFIKIGKPTGSVFPSPCRIILLPFCGGFGHIV